MNEYVCRIFERAKRATAGGSIHHHEFFVQNDRFSLCKICIVLAEIFVCQRLSLVGILITVITKRCRSQELAKELSAREREISPTVKEFAIVCLLKLLCSKAIRNVIVTSLGSPPIIRRGPMKISVADKRQ